MWKNFFLKYVLSSFPVTIIFKNRHNICENAVFVLFFLKNSSNRKKIITKVDLYQKKFITLLRN